jgi:hypothetical protein
MRLCKLLETARKNFYEVDHALEKENVTQAEL